MLEKSLELNPEMRIAADPVQDLAGHKTRARDWTKQEAYLSTSQRVGYLASQWTSAAFTTMKTIVAAAKSLGAPSPGHYN